MSKARQLAQKPNQPSGRKNMIINGAMDVHQRGGTITVSNGTGYTLDRFKMGRGSSYNFNVDVSQSTTAPTDFVNSLKIDVQATATPSSGENAVLEQHIESQNTTHLNYGSSSGKYIVLSFWVRSNKTGTYGLQLIHNGKSRNFVSSYTISSADTWEKKTIVINPDTAGAAFDDDNAAGFRVIWHLSTGPDDILSGNRDWTDDGSFRSVTGQVNLFDSTSNEFYLTGVQLEVGTVATEFEHRSFGEELALCQRYFFKLDFPVTNTIGTAFRGTTNTGRITLICPVPLRTLPSINSTGQPTLRFWWNDGSDVIVSTDGSISVMSSSLDTNRFVLSCSNVTGLGNNVGSVWAYSGDLEISAEL